MVVWDSVDLEIKANMASYLQATLENKETGSYESLRWDKLHKDVSSMSIQMDRKPRTRTPSWLTVHLNASESI
jgi:hypothetical protein